VNKVSKAETNTKAITLTAVLSDEKIAKACFAYGGDIIKMVGITHEE
jgi:hypothetical protein